MSEEGSSIGLQCADGPVTVSSSSSLDSSPVMDVLSSDSSTDHGQHDSVGTGELISSSSSLNQSSSEQQQYASQLDPMQTLLLPAPHRSSIRTAQGYPPVSPGRVQGIPSSIGSMLVDAPQSPTVTTVAAHNSTPEFLYQLTKMLSDGTNRDTIEWSNGRIEVHSPHRLETHVLNKYFRHSKFASFQRQLNYFGFRKLAGKGKMAPCSYVNDAATDDLGSLLHMKRKVPLLPQSKDKVQVCKGKSGPSTAAKPIGTTGEAQVNPVLAGILQRNKDALGGPSRALLATVPVIPTMGKPLSLSTPQELARAAAGRGIRHSLLAGMAAPTPSAATISSPQFESTGMNSATRALQEASFALPASASLSQLEINFRNTINDMDGNSLLADADPTPLNEMIAPQYGFLSRDSSLIDLAMIPPVEDNVNPSTNPDTFGLNFDFPDPDDRNSSPPKSDPSAQPG